MPANHPDAAALLGTQVDEVTARLETLDDAAAAAVAEPLPEGDEQVAARHAAVLRALLGQAQPVLPRWKLAAAAPVTASLDGRADLVATTTRCRPHGCNAALSSDPSSRPSPD